MAICPRCGTGVLPASRFCAACGAPLTTSDDRTRLSGAGDRTRLAGAPAADLEATRLAGAAAARTDTATPATSRSSGGWLAASGSIDHGRFEPGTIVDGRYRVIGLLGRGGMGEVYRADDLRLGQPVALKFLPDALATDVQRLAQFHNEVRLARQVSHQNVCRVHDIGEVDGHPYLTMEYVDGEDLATSLRRVGRFAEDRALDLARQICAGLSAAHERGILHRDLKPANVMLDTSGRVRIMDFGLAAIGAVSDIRAGTPAYMAPEQLGGREVTPRSDIYALGLVMYEVFTGKRVFEVASLAELLDRHEQATITRPGEHVRGLDPAIERVVLRCLEVEPERRPASALAVAAALPGGDPLAAALAAGETPSPAMVAAAGGQAATIGPVRGAVLLAAVAGALLLAIALAERVQLVGLIAWPLHPRTLVDRARQFEQSLGLDDLVRDRASGLFSNVDIRRWLWSRPAEERARLLEQGWPPPVLFWHRTSPRLLVPSDNARPQPTRGDPPMTITGMTITALGTDGRLLEFLRVPEQREGGRQAPAAPMDWAPFFDAAGLDAARFAAVEPEWTPRYFADERVAWLETSAAAIGTPLRVEAAAHRGRPVSFQIVGPWARPTREMAPPVSQSAQIVGIVSVVFIVPAMLVAGVLLARRNIRLGRGDRRGAVTIAIAVFAISMFAWLFGSRHFAALLEAQTRVGVALAWALATGALFGLLYLAFEPTVRRVWPQMLMTWSRLLAGRFRDPFVGRDLLFGAAAGLMETLVTFASHLLPRWIGAEAFPPAPVNLDVLMGTGRLIGELFGLLEESFANAIIGAVGLVLFRMVVRREWLTLLVAMLLFAPLAASGQIDTGRLALDLAFGTLLVGIVLWVLFRYGLFAGIVAFFVHLMTKDVPLTFDGSRIDFGASISVASIVVVIALAGFWLARADQPLFGRLAED